MDKLTIDVGLEALAECYHKRGERLMAISKQLADTMRENEQLRAKIHEYNIQMQPNKESDNGK